MYAVNLYVEDNFHDVFKQCPRIKVPKTSSILITTNLLSLSYNHFSFITN